MPHQELPAGRLCAGAAEPQEEGKSSCFRWLLVIIAMPILAIISVVGLLIWIVLLPIKIICCPIGDYLLASHCLALCMTAGKRLHLNSSTKLASERTIACTCSMSHLADHSSLQHRQPTKSMLPLQVASYNWLPMLWSTCSRRLSKHFFGLQENLTRSAMKNHCSMVHLLFLHDCTNSCH